jgi:hypothetical protein
MIPTRTLAWAALRLLAVGISGCGGGLGDKRYACTGLPSRPLCLSTYRVYELTDRAGPPPAEVLAQQEQQR